MEQRLRREPMAGVPGESFGNVTPWAPRYRIPITQQLPRGPGLCDNARGRRTRRELKLASAKRHTLGARAEARDSGCEPLVFGFSHYECL